MPIVREAKLAENIFDLKKVEQKPTRDGYGLGLVELGEKDEGVGRKR
ncbi:hypothetical protein HYS99_01180 [Candidatus Giovannonibacteria bacterium]|nr:hypothetical protein [Candidatus Giovannonibacteria bacterium]